MVHLSRCFMSGCEISSILGRRSDEETIALVWRGVACVYRPIQKRAADRASEGLEGVLNVNGLSRLPAARETSNIELAFC
jgi:hypothetical protein